MTFTVEELKMIAELCDAGIRCNGVAVVEKLAPLFKKTVAEIKRLEPEKPAVKTKRGK